MYFITASIKAIHESRISTLLMQCFRSEKAQFLYKAYSFIPLVIILSAFMVQIRCCSKMSDGFLKLPILRRIPAEKQRPAMHYDLQLPVPFEPERRHIFSLVRQLCSGDVRLQDLNSHQYPAIPNSKEADLAARLVIAQMHQPLRGFQCVYEAATACAALARMFSLYGEDAYLKWNNIIQD